MNPGRLIYGFVRDEADVPIENARVRILSGPSSLGDVTILTNANGAFLLSFPAIGRYEIACTADGYHQGRQVVDVSGENSLCIDLRLKRAYC